MAALKKELPDFCTHLCSPDTDNYAIKVLDMHTVHEKTLLLSTALFLDFMFFNSQGRGSGNDGAGGNFGNAFGGIDFGEF